VTCLRKFLVLLPLVFAPPVSIFAATLGVGTASFSFAALGVVWLVQVSFVATVGVTSPVHFLLASVLRGYRQLHLFTPISFFPFFASSVL